MTAPVIPSEAIEACIVAGAKKSKQGQIAKAGAFCLKHAKLEYKGPRTAEELWANEKFRIVAGVKVGQSRIMRTRPIFHDWSAVIEVEYDDEQMNANDIEGFLDKCGKLVGLCDWRPKYGRFSVKKVA